jgi:hypothetical protein
LLLLLLWLLFVAETNQIAIIRYVFFPLSPFLYWCGGGCCYLLLLVAVVVVLVLCCCYLLTYQIAVYQVGRVVVIDVVVVVTEGVWVVGLLFVKGRG